MHPIDLPPHPDTPSEAIENIAVAVAHDGRGGLTFDFVLRGHPARLHLPHHAAGRADDLWRHTCCEVFIRSVRDTAYREFNFAPGQAWQCYDFDDYRIGRRLPVLAEPLFGWSVSSDYVVLCARLDADSLPMPPWRLNLAAVVEERCRRLSYWALAHPHAHPDFHHPDAFVLHLKPPC